MSDQINVFCVKWVPLEEPWRHNGSMYLDVHVYDLKNQLFNTMNGKDFNFYLLTNHTGITDPDITIIDITKWGYEKWWNKMLLFNPDISKEGINLYFDLDVTLDGLEGTPQYPAPEDIDNNCWVSEKWKSEGKWKNYEKFPRQIDWMIDWVKAQPDKLRCIYKYWTPVEFKRNAYYNSGWNPRFAYPTLINTSFMGWNGRSLKDMWWDFEKDADFNMTRFWGNDDYLEHLWPDRLAVMPRKIFYSYFYGAEHGSEFFDKDKEMFIKRQDYYVRLLNGKGKRIDYSDEMEVGGWRD